MKSILQKKEIVLREIAKEVPIQQITSPKIKKILKEMSLALRGEDDGVAIAAPQIGYSLRIFIVSEKIFDKNFIKKRKLEYNKKINNDIQNTKNEELKDKKIYKDYIFINPKITKLSHEKIWMPEGCLSVRPLYGMTYRSKKATISAYNEEGIYFTRGASNLLAQIFQHETDHLNGILFIDHAKDIKEEIPNNLEN